MTATWLAQVSRASFLDIFALSAARPDETLGAFHEGLKTSHRGLAHRDCVHYCLPGPADAWASALYNLLLNNEKYAGAAPGPAG